MKATKISFKDDLQAGLRKKEKVERIREIIKVYIFTKKNIVVLTC